MKATNADSGRPAREEKMKTVKGEISMAPKKRCQERKKLGKKESLIFSQASSSARHGYEIRPKRGQPLWGTVRSMEQRAYKEGSEQWNDAANCLSFKKRAAPTLYYRDSASWKEEFIAA